jgi:hypothetical protein
MHRGWVFSTVQQTLIGCYKSANECLLLCVLACQLCLQTYADEVSGVAEVV